MRLSPPRLSRAEALLLATHRLELLAERRFFFAQARHQQNPYYRAVA
jgi:hypothetical protein